MRSDEVAHLPVPNRLMTNKSQFFKHGSTQLSYGSDAYPIRAIIFASQSSIGYRETLCGIAMW